ncbi:chalcone isomerase family protein [Pseudomonas sp. NPDC087358]|uniref:chalcone isomerase family protein n=1 Tax=Pseudomonas sp. NPDC087358 TaxID=3364439 RepID=UPI0038507DA7
MRHRFIPWMLLLLALGSPLVVASQADLLKRADFPGQLNGQSPALERKNQAILTYLWTDVYAAAFYAEPSVSARQAVFTQAPQKLALFYFRDIDRNDVIKAANATLERQQTKETLSRLRQELDRLHQSFQDIKPGDRYDLSWDRADGLNLLRNGIVIFASPDPELAKVYFAIWLAPDGLSADLREALLK